ncbi:MAG: polynucleotide adenylyltransferase PcnB [Planctomycetes bacterium]|nr:polynucleotide adenylyltransferase PcnB [Planctomycetota bacterium]
MSFFPTQPRVVSAQGRIQPGSLNPDATRVVERLQSAGFEAYFVGGCVRDLWLGRAPKDFDIATSARPRQIRRIFRNCRIIGRRFKLAHVVFRRPDGTEHIVETATFRRAPDPQDESPDELLITDDNTFGTAAEDAARRDFTLNALFFDPRHWCIIDYVGGLDDLQRLRLKTIGDPNIRLREDPVRILRAVKFASRLNFKISFDTYDAMVRHASDLHRAAPPRLLEEILRLLRGGHAFMSFQLLHQCGALAVILPEIVHFLDNESRQGPRGKFYKDLFWRDLTALDESVKSGDPVTPAFLEALLFYRIFERELDPNRRRSDYPIRDPLQVADATLDPFGRRLRVSKFDIGRAKQICGAQTRFFIKAGKKFRTQQFVTQESFAEALAMLRMHCVALEGIADAAKLWSTYEAWYQLFKRKHVSSGDPSDDPEYFESPAAEPTFDELWHLPIKQDRDESRPPAAPPKNVTKVAAPEPEPPPEPPPPAADVEPVSATTLQMANARAASRVPKPVPDADAPSAPPKPARESLKFKITRPDAKFDFPENPMIVAEDPPMFGNW